METKSPFLELIRLSSELVQESARLRLKARETLSQSAVIIDQSRELLFAQWPVNGTPTTRCWAKRSADPVLVVPGNASEPPKDIPPLQAEAVLEQVVEQNLNGRTVQLDGKHFIDCSVENCVLEYSGGPVIMEGTNFNACRFRFAGEAAMTVAMLECFGLVEQNVASVVSPSGSSQRIN